MFHEELWRVLDDLIVEFRKRGEIVPSEIMQDLRSAKSLIHISRADPSIQRDTTQIEVYLNSVETYLMSRAQKFGERFVGGWMRRLEEAREGVMEEFTTSPTISRFLPGIPREMPWVRVRISKEISLDTAGAVARESGLFTDSREKGYLLVYGQKEKLQQFITEMTKKFRDAKKSST